ncbi:MAG: YczE/YyaS/YitT family protein [Lachnospirales bacterium]
MNLKAESIKRVIVYGMGLMILAFGIAFSINSNLGVSPVSSLPYVVSLILGTNLSRGIFLVYCISVVIQIIILRKDFKIRNLMQLVVTFFFGYFTDFANYVLGDFCFPTYFGQLLMLGISIVLMAIGLCTYINVQLQSMPIESLIQAFALKITKKPFHETKIYIDSSLVIIAVVLSFLFLGNIQGVREGTLLAAVLVGRTMKEVRKVILPLLDKYVFDSKESEKA